MIKNFSSFNESKQKFPNLKKVLIDGYTLIIGKDAKSNDHLTTVMADPEDMWFHVKGKPGCHAIIRQRDKLVTKEIKREVAEIVAKNSKIKGDCVVICCKSKFVKKNSGMNDGQVSVDYKNAEEISIHI